MIQGRSCALEPKSLRVMAVFAAVASVLGLFSAQAAEPAKPVGAAATAAAAPTASHPAEIAPPLKLVVGKSTLVRLPGDVTRVSVGDPETADAIILSPREIYFLGKRIGATNVFLWAKGGGTTIMDVSVTIDTVALQEKLNQLMPEEKKLTVGTAGDSLVLTGQVTDPVKVHRAVSVAEQFGGKKVINMLGVSDSAQVMLEVKIAEVSKTLLDKLGAQFNGSRTSGNFTYSLITSLLAGASGTASVTRAGGGSSISLDAEIKNGLVKILAEPTIMAVSGQEGAFLAGGKIFIPVPQTGISGAVTVTLEEKEFGVGLRFTPTVLEGGRINLRVTPEVSELSQVGVPFTTVGGTTSVLPSITTRRASTTVELFDGQSFAIGGLIKNNVTEAVRAIPVLGEIPVLGVLFRSSEFQNDRSELLFIVTPRLVKPLAANYALPTDKFIPPTRSEFFLEGRMEGQPNTESSATPELAPARTESAAPHGFELR